MEVFTIQKNINTSPRKIRLVADMIRGMKPQQALNILQFTNKAAAAPLSKAIETALANGKSLNGELSFKSIEINEGSKMKRYRAGTAGRGRGRPYKRRLSHIKVVLTDEVILSKKELMKLTKQAVKKASPIKTETKKMAPVKEEVVEAKVEEPEVIEGEIVEEGKE